MPELDLVVFDCDGVLVDSERISNAVLARRLQREGLDLTVAESRERHQGKLLEEIMELVEAELSRPLPPGWAEEYEAERDIAFRAELTAVPGAREAVQAVLDAGVRVCVASQGRRVKTELTLTLTGLRDLFEDDALFSAEQVARGKPEPDLYLHAVAAMRATPDRSAAVEDSPSGARAARAAGMRVLGYDADGDPDALREAGAELVSSMREVPSRLGLS